jgi:hypothetical protein
MQRDYILRMIEQMALIVARLRRRILGGDPGAADDLQSEAARHGVDLPLAKAMDVESLLLVLSPGGYPEPAHCWLMAEMLYLDGLHAEAAGRIDESLGSYRRSLRLFLALDPRVIGGIPEAAERIAELERRIGILAHDSDPSAA